jgi:chorismate synthase
VNWVAAGAVAKRVLATAGVEVAAHVNQIGDVEAADVDFETIRENVEETAVRCADLDAAERMREAIDRYQREGDSIGGSIYFEVQGVPRGLGAPRFDAVEARLGQALLAVPATTAFEFGLGRAAREYAGLERNEDWTFDADGDPVPVGNDHGGLQGGITTGQPIYGEVTLHAPTSIPSEQTTVDWETGEEKTAQVIGRHDPVLPPRGVPVVEAMLAITVLDFMLLGGRINPDRLDDDPGEYATDYHPSSPQSDPTDADTRVE